MRWPTKTLSVLLTVSILLTSTPWVEAAPAFEIGAPQFSRLSLKLPQELGFITDRYVSPESIVQSPKSSRSGLGTWDSRFVVLIQDLHVHAPTQRKIRGILEYLFKNKSGLRTQ